MKKFLVRTGVNAAALWVAVFLLSGVTLKGAVSPDNPIANASPGWQQFAYYLLAGAILALANSLVRPVVKFLSFPAYILTFGLFFIVVNALMLMLTSWITGNFDIGVFVDGFWWAVAGGIVIGLINTLFDALLPKDYRRK